MNVRQHYDEAMRLSNIAVLFYGRKEPKGAIPRLELAITSLLKIPSPALNSTDLSLLQSCYQHLSTTYNSVGDVDNAIATMKKVIELMPTIRDMALVDHPHRSVLEVFADANYIRYLGDLYMKSGDTNLAKQSYENVLKFFTLHPMLLDKNKEFKKEFDRATKKLDSLKAKPTHSHQTTPPTLPPELPVATNSTNKLVTPMPKVMTPPPPPPPPPTPPPPQMNRTADSTSMPALLVAARLQKALPLLPTGNRAGNPSAMFSPPALSKAASHPPAGHAPMPPKRVTFIQ